jgi:hypothetical protein
VRKLVGFLFGIAGCMGQAPEEPVVPASAQPADDEDKRDHGSQSSVTPTMYLERIAAVHCEQAFMCRDSYPGETAAFETTWSTSVPLCAVHLVAKWDANTIETEVAKGRIKFDGTAAVSCLDGVVFGSCAEHWALGIQWAKACYHVLVGTVATGGGCDTSYACVSNRCDLDARRCL